MYENSAPGKAYFNMANSENSYNEDETARSTSSIDQSPLRGYFYINFKTI